MSRLTRRLAVLAGGTALVVVATAGTAWAHTEAEAEASGATAADSGRTRITLTVDAECGGNTLPTSGLRVQLPEGATDVQPSGEGGWTTQVTATEVAWSSASPAPGKATFIVEMVLAQAVGETVYLPAIQACPDGSDIAWIQIPAFPGENLPNPAPEIVVPVNDTTPTSAAAAAATSTTAAGPTTTATMAIPDTPITLEGSETSSAGLIVFIVVVVAIGGGALILYLRYRSKGNQSRGTGTGSGPDAAPPAA
jgi:uncharacterized protein YcnI